LFMITRHRNRLEQGSHTALSDERLHEGRAPQPVDDLGSDPTTQVEASRRQKLEGEITSFGTIKLHEQVQGLTTDPGAPLQSRFRYRWGGAALFFRFLDEPVGPVGDPVLEQELEDVGEPGTGNQSFPADMIDSAAPGS